MNAIFSFLSKYIPKEQFLIIPSGRLRRNTAAVFAEVLSFLGLQPEQAQQAQQASSETTVSSPYTGDEVGALWGTCDAEEGESRANQRRLDKNAVEKHFPSEFHDPYFGKHSRSPIIMFIYLLPADFARSTGWSIQSEYAPLPEDIHQQMQEFFAEQNELLFQLIGRNLENDW